MEKLSPKALLATEDWRDSYLEKGQEMIELATGLLEKGDDESIDLGLKIVEGAYFEEDEENPDVPPSLSKLDFAPLVPLLKKVEENKKYAKRAKRGLWIIEQENAEAKPAPNLEAVLEGLKSKSGAKVNKAVAELWTLVHEGADISSALPYILEHQEALAMATDAMGVVAGFYLKEEKYAELEAWLNSSDEQTSIRAYRGLAAAAMKGIDANTFAAREGVRGRLEEISETGSFMLDPEEFLNP